MEKFDSIEEGKDLLIRIHNSVKAIENILKEVHKTKICMHINLNKNCLFWTMTNDGKSFETHKCEDCGALVSIKKVIEKGE